jgi:hypothetical protein
MPGREHFDILNVLADAVAPALAAVFRAGEIQSVQLVWDEPVVLPDGTQSRPTEMKVHLVCNGEGHTSYIWVVGDQEYDADALKRHLIDEFSDYVAESGWGWGQQR